ncbi:MAG: hypothetical protein IJJ26_05115 [Victivallales bacterium]|nr:hypothetical protein [Victivallales bacterium]
MARLLLTKGEDLSEKSGKVVHCVSVRNGMDYIIEEIAKLSFNCLRVAVRWLHRLWRFGVSFAIPSMKWAMRCSAGGAIVGHTDPAGNPM